MPRFHKMLAEAGDEGRKLKATGGRWWLGQAERQENAAEITEALDAIDGQDLNRLVPDLAKGCQPPA